MEDFFDEQNNQGFFESFSDVALCTLTVTLVLLSLLATSVRQSLNITLNENQFNQDALPNRTYLTYSISLNGAEKLIHFLDADRIDDIRIVGQEKATGRRINLDEARSLSDNHFSLVAPALVPGFNVNGEPTILQLPTTWEPNVEVEGRMHQLDYKASKAVLNKCSLREPFDGRARRTRVYVESMRGENDALFAVIGHAAYELPQSLLNGSLDWLKSFMSGTIDLIYLGDISNKSNANIRLQFMEDNGFYECATNYLHFLSNKKNGEVKKMVPFSEYGNAWRAYVDWRVGLDEDPPSWFFTEFLVKLGFDRMVMDAPTGEL